MEREEILNIKNEAFAQITIAQTKEELENLRAMYLGKNGKLTNLIKRIKEIPPESRREQGMAINEAKQNIEKLIFIRRQEIIKKASENEEWFDITIPGIKPKIGSRHPLIETLNKVENIFRYLGYQVAEGPEIENDYYNFEALNIPKDHPARDTQMTFYLNVRDEKGNPKILRTQTSAMQVRVMERTKPPFRVLVPGRNFRYEQVDASHGFEFWQVEGFVVDRDIKLTDLFGTIDFVLRELFGQDIKLRFATTNFPFVEPGVDTYLGCTICHQKGCSFCKNTGWSEIMPAGMIHPKVLERGGINPQEWRGFAFAIGLSRIVNLKYRIDDLRILNTPDSRILSQFK